MKSSAPKKVKKIALKRGHSRRFRVWFKDGTDAVLFGKYPSDVLESLPAQIAVKVRDIVEAV